MDPVDIFAGLVTRHFRERPALTRGIIRTGYAAQQTLLRLRPEEGLLPSQQYLARICMDYTRRPLRRPETSALVNLFFPCELLHAMDLSPQCVEGFSAFLCGGRCERGFMQLAEEVGVPDTYCSFHKGLLGAVFARTVQKPRFILTTNTVCDANTTTFDAIARHYDMPRRMIDVPYEETPGAVLYVADQLRGLVGILEEELGRGMDPARLRLAIDRSNVALAAHQSFLDELAERFVPTQATTELYRILCNHILMGSEEAQVFSQTLLRDVKGCAPRAGKRILWCHLLPFYAESLRGRFLDREGVQLLASDLSFDAMTPLDPERPYESLALRLIQNHFNGPVHRRAGAAVRMANRLRADGVVLFCHWGCKQNNGGVFQMRDALREAGFATVVLDGDGCDRRNMGQGQFDTRFQAFLEMLEGGV